MIAIGSIVEGVDWNTETHELKYPFTEEDFWEAIALVECEAKDIWNSTHGCEKCGEEDYETGYIAINPLCESCKGKGIIM